MKSTYIHIRVTPEQKQAMKQMAQERGFGSMSALVLWLTAYAQRHIKS